MFVMGRRARFTQEELAAAVEGARSYSEVLRSLGYRVAGGNHYTVKKYVEAWGLRTDHFDPNWALKGGRQKRLPLSEILVEGSTYSRGKLKERLYAEGLKQPRCELCGQDALWRGREMALTSTTSTGSATTIGSRTSGSRALTARRRSTRIAAGTTGAPHSSATAPCAVGRSWSATRSTATARRGAGRASVALAEAVAGSLAQSRERCPAPHTVSFFKTWRR